VDTGTSRLLKASLVIIGVLLVALGVHWFILGQKKPVVHSGDTRAEEYALLPQVLPSVVSIIGIDTSKPGLYQGGNFGSGFVIDSKGYILTNKHVVADNYSYSVVFPDGRKENTEVIYKDPVKDLALLKIEGKGLTALKLSNAQTEIDQSVFGIGNGGGKQIANLADGKITDIDTKVVAEGGQVLSGLIQTSVKLLTGDSGSPLFNLDGEVVGMNVAVGADGSSFAIPASEFKNILKEAR
jgi:S1-C subfamily serine protease